MWEKEESLTSDGTARAPAARKTVGLYWSDKAATPDGSSRGTRKIVSVQSEPQTLSSAPGRGSLSGTLQDFDLSHIFQMIGLDGKTGRLEIASEGSWGYVVFEKGNIIAAGENDHDLLSMLQAWLVYAGRCSVGQLTRIRQHGGNTLRGISLTLVEWKLVDPEELGMLAGCWLEDIVCSLFSWEQGHYRFVVENSMARYQIESIELSCEAVTMEAMRRADEVKRMRSAIGPGTVFIRTSRLRPESSRQPADPEYFENYVLSLIDGTQPITQLCRQPLVTEYRLYEAICMLMCDGYIEPLAERISRAVNAAHRRKSPIPTRLLGQSIVRRATAAALVLILGGLLWVVLWSDFTTSLSSLPTSVTRMVRTATDHGPERQAEQSPDQATEQISQEAAPIAPLLVEANAPASESPAEPAEQKAVEPDPPVSTRKTSAGKPYRRRLLRVDNLLSQMDRSLARNDFQGVLRAYDKLSARHAGQPWPLTCRLRALEALHRYDELEKFFADQSLVDPEYMLAHARLLLHQKKYDEALTRVVASYGIVPAFAEVESIRQEAVYLRARCLAGINSEQDSEKTRQEALEAWFNVKYSYRNSQQNARFSEANTWIRQLSSNER
jgi:hypothetical protein